MVQLRGWRFILTVLAVSLIGLTLGRLAVRAGALTDTRDYLQRQRANLTSGQTHQVFFTPATSVAGSGNTVVLDFPITQPDSWCRTAGADLTATGIANPEGATENATPLPGSLSAGCSQGNGPTQGDQLIISGAGPLAAGTPYGVSVADGGAASLGTPASAASIFVVMTTTDGSSSVDTGSLAVAIGSNDRVSIAANVQTAPTPPTNPVVQFRGRASPNASLKIVRDGSLVESLAADADATFDATLSSQSAGQHLYEISAGDADGRSHPSLTFGLNLTAGSTTVITGIFFGPTIAAQPAQVKLGEPVTLLGRTAPGSTVSLTIDSSPPAATAVADGQGKWAKVGKSREVGPGTPTARARAVAPDHGVSEPSQTISFVVNRIQPPVNRRPPIISGLAADLNRDGRVNLTDFSILLFFWQQADPVNHRVDISRDGRVTVVDFSIMLFQWTG